jgi:hypothetical protein
MPSLRRTTKPTGKKTPAKGGKPARTKPSRSERAKQIKMAFKLTRDNDPRLVLVLLAAFLVPLVVFVALGVLLGHPIYLGILGLLSGVLALVAVFGRRMQKMQYSQVEGQPGAARMAMEAGVPILPVVIWGSQRIFTKNRKKDLRRGAHVRIVVGETFTPDPAGSAVDITAELKQRMDALLAEARATYKGVQYDGDDTWWIPASMGGTAPTLEAAAERDRADKERKAAKREAKRAAKA